MRVKRNLDSLKMKKTLLVLAQVSLVLILVFTVGCRKDKDDNRL